MGRILFQGNRFVFVTPSAFSNTGGGTGAYPSGTDYISEASSGNTALAGLLPLLSDDVEFLVKLECGFNTGYPSLAGRLPFGARLVGYLSIWDSGYSLRYGYHASMKIEVLRGATSLGSSSITQFSGPFYERFQVVGTDIKAKAWADGSSEPAWQIQVTDSTYTSGYIGVASRTVRFYFLGIGTAGSTPPSSGPLMTISGQVTRGGSPVSGAVVTAVLHTVDYSLPLIPGIHIVQTTTDSNGNYSLDFYTDDPGPWLISARAIINGVYYASDARLVYLG